MSTPPCADGPDVFFTESDIIARIAQRVCWEACRVRLQCLVAGMAQPEHGIWGGYTPQERERLRRGLRVSPRPLPEVN